MPLIANRYDYHAVVVIGAARSGTRFLRPLIGSVPDFATVPFDSNHIWRIGNEHAADDQLDAASLTPRRVNIIRRTLWRLAEGGAGARVLVEKTVSNRSEEHTSELQSHSDLVCRLLLEKKKRRK